MSVVRKHPIFLDISSASEISGLSIRSLRKVIEKGEILTVQIKRKQFILGRSFQAWMLPKETKK